MRSLKNLILQYEKSTKRKNKNLRCMFNHHHRQHSYLKGGGGSCLDVVSDLRDMKTLLKNTIKKINRIENECMQGYGRATVASTGSNNDYMGMGQAEADDIYVGDSDDDYMGMGQAEGDSDDEGGSDGEGGSDDESDGNDESDGDGNDKSDGDGNDKSDGDGNDESDGDGNDEHVYDGMNTSWMNTLD